MLVTQRRALDVLEIILLVIMFNPSLGNNGSVNIACEYPSCKCTQLTESPVSFLMECRTSSIDTVILPTNKSTNIVHLVVQCSEKTNLLIMLERLRNDLTSVSSLTLDSCDTALHDIIATENFQNLQNLTLRGANGYLSDINKLSTGLVGLGELMFLNIFNSSLAEVPSLCSQSELVSLNLSGNVLATIGRPYQKCAAITQTKLRILDLSGNQLTELGPWISQTTKTSLTDLYLSSNLLDENDFSLLTNLSDLTSLDMSRNVITALLNGSFRNNPRLRSLNISRNLITIMETGALTGLSRLEHLDLSHNSLSVIQDGAFSELRHLKRLHLGFNSLSSLPFNIFDPLVSLQYLYLMNNKLVSVPTFRHLGSLLALNLKNNKIRGLERDTFSNLTLLQGISLSGNSLTAMEFETFDFSKSLFLIDLSYNNISSLSDGMDSRRVLSNLATVSYLRLDYNQIAEISLIEKHFISLKYLFLDNNQIRIVHRTSLPMSLKIINLSDNKISKIESNTFKYMNNLELVTVQRNYPHLSRLSRWSIQIHSELEPKPKFYIGGNLFVCDCNMAYLKAWDEKRNRIPALRRYHPYFADLKDVYCITPYDKEATNIRDVPMSHFVCKYKDGRHCPYGCGCCLKPNCTCDYYCPQNCSCHYGGSLWTNDVYDRIQCNNRSLKEIPQNIPLTTTHLYLGGNEIQSLSSDRFHRLAEVRYLYLNNSGITRMDPAVFSGMNKLESLFLDHNLIFELSKESFKGLQQLKELHLENNRISYIEEHTFSMLINLTYLNLENNLLNTLSTSIFSSHNHLQTIMLLGNHWSCDCQSMSILKTFMQEYSSLVKDASKLRCYWRFSNSSHENRHLQNYSEKANLLISQESAIPVLQYEYDSICSNHTATMNVSVQHVVFFYDHKLTASLVTLIIIIAISLATAVLLYWKRKELQAWVFVQFGWRIQNKNKNINEVGRRYDAFVSYCSKDEHIVVRELAPKLEGGDNPYKLCLHYRDFPVGDCIADTIINSIEASKRTLMLISENFLTSEWCRYEFQTAHHHILKENTHRLIMVLLEDLDMDHVDPDLRVHLKVGHFLRYDDPWFWEKLYFALPDREAEVVNNNVIIEDVHDSHDDDDDNDDVFYTEAQINDINLAKERLQEEHRV